MSEKSNRALALEVAHTFGHRNHKELLKTAMDIERYLDSGTRPPVLSDGTTLTFSIPHEFERDVLTLYKFHTTEWILKELAKIKRTAPATVNQEVEFSIQPEEDTDGNFNLKIVGELKPLSNSKKK